MNVPDRHRKSPKKGTTAVRWLAVLALTGLFSILVTPLGAEAANTHYNIALTVLTNTQRAVGRQTTIQAQLTAIDASPISGQTVHFTVSGGNPMSMDAPNTTDGSGTTTFTYTGDNPGEDTIQASVGTDTSNNVTVDWASLSLSPATQTVQPGQDATINVTLENGLPVNGQDIYYSVAGPAGAIPDTAATSTDGSGQTTVSYTRTAAADGTTDTVTVWADLNGNATYNPNQEPIATVEVTWNEYQINITSAPTAANVGTSASFTATVTDQTDNPVQGVEVRFDLPSGPNSPHTGVDTTDSSGEATFSYTGLHAGTDTVRAYIDLNGNTSYDSGEPADSVNVTWTDITFTLSPTTQNVGTGTQVELTGTVTDGSGSGVASERIRYSVSGANSAGGSVFTNSSGDGTFHYTAGYAGTDTVTAYVDLNQNNQKDTGEPSDSATVYVSAPSISLTPSTQTVTANTQASLTASLSNTNVDVSGVTIRYSVSGANSTSGTATTDANGNATINYTGTLEGTDTVTAYADLNGNSTQDSGEPSASATVNWTLTATLSLAPTTTTPGVGTTSYTAVSLTTSAGGVPGVPIRYSVSGANSTSQDR